jgi:hypothetical protein
VSFVFTDSVTLLNPARLRRGYLKPGEPLYVQADACEQREQAVSDWGEDHAAARDGFHNDVDGAQARARGAITRLGR